MSGPSFGARLRVAMDTRGPLCAGIDPHASLLAAWDLPDSVAGLEEFALGAAEALGPAVAAIKPQSAFFERFGSRGVAVLERTIAVCREAGALVVLDVKRGDIGSTAQAYADAYLDPTSPIAVDAITASPYLGFGSLVPMLDTARRHGAGVFVLALTSNPEGPQFQHATTADGRSVAATVLASLREAGARMPRAAVLLSPWTDLSVSSATYERLRKLDPVISRERLGAAGRWYAGQRDLRDPMASPLFADAAGLPPLLIHAGGDETMLDDSRLFAERARAAGVDVTFTVYDGMWHVHHWGAPEVPESVAAYNDIAAFIRAQFGG